MFAVAMNGEPLTPEHGFPVRMVVPGLYGYVSATKWVVDLEVTRFSDFSAFWTQRGWSVMGPVKTQSRIDVPRNGSSVSAGRVVVAGVAWAQHRGIRKVEVKVDDGPWQGCRIAADPTIDSWRQWSYEWQAHEGEPLRPGPRHRRDRTDPDQPGGRSRAERRDRLRQHPAQRPLTGRWVRPTGLGVVCPRWVGRIRGPVGRTNPWSLVTSWLRRAARAAAVRVGG